MPADRRYLGHGIDVHPKRALPVHGIPGVHRHVHERRLELGSVRLDEAGIAGGVGLDPDAASHDGAQHVRNSPDPLWHIEHFGLERLPSGKGEQLSCELGGTVHSVGDCINISNTSLLGQVGPAQELDGRADDGEQVVEVVRHAARELPHRFQLL